MRAQLYSSRRGSSCSRAACCAKRLNEGCVTALLWVIFASWPRLLQIWRATELQCTWGAAAVQGAAKGAVCRCGTLVQQGALRITWITVDTACWITVVPRSETDTQHSCRITGGNSAACRPIAERHVPSAPQIIGLKSTSESSFCTVGRRVLPFQFIVNPPLFLNYFFACGLILSINPLHQLPQLGFDTYARFAWGPLETCKQQSRLC
jgi:hypothetical protein